MFALVCSPETKDHYDRGGIKRIDGLELFPLSQIGLYGYSIVRIKDIYGGGGDDDCVRSDQIRSIHQEPEGAVFLSRFVGLYWIPHIDKDENAIYQNYIALLSESNSQTTLHISSWKFIQSDCLFVCLFVQTCLALPCLA